MDGVLLISFILVSVGVIVIPGPNILVIVSTSMSHGTKRGLQTVAGTTCAMALQLLVAALGTSGFIELLTHGFYIIKWLGVAYLAYLGMLHIKQVFSKTAISTVPSASSSFSRGFIVSLTNPKTILFFAAFLPQFVSVEGHYLAQVTLLSVIFLFLAAFIDALYALFSAQLKVLLRWHGFSLRLQKTLSGSLFLGASVWLALMRRTD